VNKEKEIVKITLKKGEKRRKKIGNEKRNLNMNRGERIS
jgi:hypothetical protein